MIKDRLIEIVKSGLAMTPYRLVRDRGANRFQAIETALTGLRGRGFSPDMIIDGGAHLGWFSLAAEKIFPNARFVLVEPQAACFAELRAICTAKGWILHECALGESEGAISFTRTHAPSTGAHARLEAGPDTAWTPVRTIDDLLNKAAPFAHGLFKLDLQGFELFALRGARGTLARIDAVLLEASVYAQAYEPSMFEIFQFFEGEGFEFHDVAALSGRTRDNRLHQCDLIFARKNSGLAADRAWE